MSERRREREGQGGERIRPLAAKFFSRNGSVSRNRFWVVLLGRHVNYTYLKE